MPGDDPASMIAGWDIGAAHLKCAALWARHRPGTTPVASASAAFTALKAERGVLIDIGSTTTDIIRFGGGRVQYQGYTDGERLRSEELVYTGALRTPIMAVAERVPFAGKWQRLTAEPFATMADAYGLLGRLGERGRETQDGAGTAPEDCARRIARMLGRRPHGRPDARLAGARRVSGADAARDRA